MSEEGPVPEPVRKPRSEPGQRAAVGARVAKLRAERGLSLAKVAQADFSRAFLNQIEKGRVNPSTRVLRVIADRLGARYEYLLEGVEPPAERQIAADRAEIELIRGNPERALEILGPALESREWPLRADVTLIRAEALAALGREAEAAPDLDGLEPDLRRLEDKIRMRRLRLARRGRRARFTVNEVLEQAERDLRSGRIDMALDRYREARDRVRGSGRMYRSAGESPPEE